MKQIQNGLCPENYSQDTLMEMINGFQEWKDKAGHRQFLHYTLFEQAILKLKDCHILDAACGIGEDAIYLAKQGFDVSINDVDPIMLERARENAREHGINFSVQPYRKKGGSLVNTTHHDWKIFDKVYFNFPAVLCMGNSFTYLFEKEDQLKALDNFRKILKRDGILIIDERNYEAMFDQAEAIRQGRFEYTGLYRLAEDVKMMPVDINDNEVKFQWTSDKTGNVLDWRFYPFKRNELLGLLRETGFRTVHRYSDYKPGLDTKADFYQYVAVK